MKYVFILLISLAFILPGCTSIDSEAVTDKPEAGTSETGENGNGENLLTVKPSAEKPAEAVENSDGPTEITAPEKKKESPRVCIEVVFVLDTTGSMSGLIHAAKEKIWAIANTLVTAKTVKEIKLGLVGYRDRGDAYVTKITPLTNDIDAVYNDLMSFKANGGGDGPESVNQALYEAVTKMDWSKDEKNFRVIFLVGDYPPHMDYKNDVKYPETCKKAAAMGLTINTIQCGNHGPTTPIWQDIARKCEGQYFRVEQSGSAILTNTPFDKELARLSRELDSTRVFYGYAEEKAKSDARSTVGEAIYAKASVKAAAQRAVYNASGPGGKNFGGHNELIQALADGKVELKNLKEEQMPDELKKLSPEERRKYVEKKKAEREKIRKKIRELSQKRQEYIKKQIAKDNKAKPSLDDKLYETIKKQAGKKGIKYKSGARY